MCDPHSDGQLAEENMDLKAELSEMKERVKFLEGVLNSMEDSVFIKNDKHERVFSNTANSRQVGLTPEEMQGKTDYDFASPEEAEVFIAKDKELLASGEPNRNQEAITSKDGSKRVISTQKSIYTNPESGQKYIVGISRDVTERVKLESERDKLIEDLKDALAHIKTMQGLVPICATCKKIRDDDGFWQQLEVYIKDHSEADFSHGICPECFDKQMQELDEYERSK